MREDVPVIEVWNKVDALDPEAADTLRNRAERQEGVQVLSALTGEGFEALQAAMAEALDEARVSEAVDLGHGEGRVRAWLFDQGVVINETTDEDGAHLTVSWTRTQKARFEAMRG